MRTRRIAYLCMAMACLPMSTRAEHLDEAAIFRMYHDEGDTKGVLDSIASFQERNKAMGRQDSLVLLKYHGMIYYHFPELNAKDYAELCFTRLIEKDTAQDIRNLGPSKAALALVENLKAEARRKARRQDSLQAAAAKAPRGRGFLGRPEVRRTAAITAGVASIGIGALAFYLMNDDKPEDRYHPVSATPGK